MLAIRVHKGRGIALTQADKPVLTKDSQVLLRITSAGICTADLAIAAGTHPFAKDGMIMGHEFGGVVEAMGSGVTGLSVGDKVTVDPVCACGACHSCALKRPNICRNLQTMGVHRDGGFAQYVVAEGAQVYRYQNQALDMRLLGVAEPYSIGAQTNMRCGVGPQDFVVVLGAGAIGLTALEDAKRRGAQVLAVDLMEARLARARRMGADYTVGGDANAVYEMLNDITQGDMADVVINTACYPGSVGDAARYAAFGGRVVIVGLDRLPIGISQADITEKELTILGSRLSTRLFGYVEEGISQGLYAPEQLVTHFFPARRAREAFAMIENNPSDVGRVVLTFEEEDCDEA